MHFDVEDFDVSLTGFSLPEIDTLLETSRMSTTLPMRTMLQLPDRCVSQFG